MPAVPSGPPRKPIDSAMAPDIRPGEVFDSPCLIQMETPEQQGQLPANFDSLPKEEQERLKARYRFLGIRLRGDVVGRTTPLTRQTLDVP